MDEKGQRPKLRLETYLGGRSPGTGPGLEAQSCPARGLNLAAKAGDAYQKLFYLHPTSSETLCSDQQENPVGNG